MIPPSKKVIYAALAGNFSKESADISLAQNSADQKEPGAIFGLFTEGKTLPFLVEPMEDSAAILGLGIAFLGILVSDITAAPPMTQQQPSS